MFSLRFLWLAQLLCILPILIQSYPHGSIEELVQAYMEGITKLKSTSPLHEDVTEKNAELEEVADPEEYDFIVVGGGTSGATIANRLTEIPEWHVLLLESGKEEDKIAQIPAMAEVLQNSEYNWGYKMEPQEHNCLGMVNNQCQIINGKGLGGTSSINSMLYSRANPLDYDRWADEELKSWCYDHILPYFKKSEDVGLEHFDNKYHNKGGPMHVENVQYKSPLAETFLEAGDQIGAHTIDYNGRHQLGFGLTQAMTALGKRRSTSSAFLAPAAHRKNLSILTNSHVTEILIGDHTHETKGVKYIKDGKLHVAKATKEVILAAGLFNSPQLLMLSGIGPKSELEKHEIPIKMELEGVGKNLQDHLQYTGLNFLINETDALPNVDLQEDLKIWLTEGKGPLTKTQDIEAIGYIKTKVSKEEKDYPDIELQFQSRPFTKEQGEIIKRSIGLTDDTYEHVWKPLEGHYIFTISPILLHPKSKGHVELKSKHSAQEPKITGNHFSDPDGDDLKTMVEGIKSALELTKTEPFQAWSSKLAEVLVPGCDIHEHGSDDYWKCCVMKLTIPHPQSGTCKMGPKTDKNSVVDEHLKVHGIHGLRVADNSVIPDALSGHSTAATIMIGEKAADMIKESWK